VFGRGYAEHLERFPNITYRGEIGLAELLREMRRARIVININANFRDGAHDRPFTAAAAGAAVASDASTYLAEQFQDGTEIKLFSWLSLEAGLADMAALAHDPERAHAMARAGQRRVIDAHLWDHRVDAILEAAEAAREARPESVAVA
jgi:spore maturation protein CgeB